MVLTIEPGLYIPDDPSMFGPLAGVGVRIEDDVAITGLLLAASLRPLLPPAPCAAARGAE